MKRGRKKLLAVLCCIPLLAPVREDWTKFEIEKNIESENIKFNTFRELIRDKIDEYNKIKEENIKKEKLNIRAIEDTIVENILPNYEDWLFEVSYYCACYDCTQNGTGLTASGNYAIEGVTIAAPSDIPFDSTIYINGLGEFVVQDRGGYIQYTYDEYGNLVMRVDVYLDSHSKCYELGRHYSYGYLIRS